MFNSYQTLSKDALVGGLRDYGQVQSGKS